VVAPGGGVVARFAGLVCVAPTDGEQATALRPDLITICQESAGSAPGRTLARRLAIWLGGLGDAADGFAFGTVSATDDGRLAVFLLGPMWLVIPELGTEVSGSDAAAWTDRLLDPFEAAVVLTTTRAETQLDVAHSLGNLQVGVVPGATAVLLPKESSRQSAEIERPVEQTAIRPRLAVEDASSPTEKYPDVPAIRAYAIPDFSDDTLSTPPPAPSSAAATEHHDSDQPGSFKPRAYGRACPRGHLNDPRSQLCILCNARMEHATPLTNGIRPPLGRLLFDNGETYTVDVEYVIGRHPESDPRVQAGTFRPIIMEDRSGEISRMHAEIRVVGWDVIVLDMGSSNGTALAAPGRDWVELPPRQPAPLVPGTRVRLGDSVFTFELPSGAG
jgi:hypothetical protein